VLFTLYNVIYGYELSMMCDGERYMGIFENVVSVGLFSRSMCLDNWNWRRKRREYCCCTVSGNLVNTLWRTVFMTLLSTVTSVTNGHATERHRIRITGFSFPTLSVSVSEKSRERKLHGTFVSWNVCSLGMQSSKDKDPVLACWCLYCDPYKTRNGAQRLRCAVLNLRRTCL